MAAPPAKSEIYGAYPNPSNAVAREGFGKLWDWLTGLLGSNLGTPAEARATLRAQLEPGCMSFVPFATPPAGWLKANGAAIAINSYPDLAAVLYCGNALNPTALFGYRTTSTSAPSSNRSTAGAFIVLPDLRGEFIRGWDEARGIDPGRDMYTLQLDAFQGHRHQPPTGVTPPNTPANPGVYLAAPYCNDTPTSAWSPASSQMTPIDQVGYGTVRTALETRPRNLALLPIIKY